MLFFGLNIKYLRTTKKISQEELSMILGTTRAAIANWESKNMSPKLDMIVNCASYFKVSVDDLVRADISKGESSTSYENFENQEKLRDEISIQKDEISKLKESLLQSVNISNQLAELNKSLSKTNQDQIKELSNQ